MEIRNLFLSLIVVILLFSCSDKNAVVNEVSLNGQIVKIDSVDNSKWPIYLLGDKLYAMDKYDFFVGQLTKKEWMRTDRVLASGHGHNEFEYMALSQDDSKTLYVLNRPFKGDKLLSLTKILNTDSIAAIKDVNKWEKYDFGQMSPFLQIGNSFVVLSDSTILVTGAPANDMSHVLSIINFNNQAVTPLDYWPDDGSPENHVKEKMLRYTYNSGLIGNGRDRFLYWNGWGMLAFIFTIDGTKTNILSHLYSNPFPNKDKPTTERVYCCSDSNRIYLLLKDSNSKGDRLEKYDSPFIFGNTVEVYDWDGVKQQIIHLDKYGQKIQLSEDSQTLYLFPDYSEDTDEPCIYSYDLDTLK